VILLSLFPAFSWGAALARKRRLTEQEAIVGSTVYRLAFLSSFYAIRPNILLPCDALPFAMCKIRPFSTWSTFLLRLTEGEKAKGLRSSMKIGVSAAYA